MKQNFFVISFLLMLVYSGVTNAQCNFLNGYQDPPLTITPDTLTFVASYAMLPGDYSAFNVIEGWSYDWSSCSGDGGVCPWNSQFTVFNATNTTIPLGYNDGYCQDHYGSFDYQTAKLVWTSTYTGTAYVQLTSNCSAPQLPTNSEALWLQRLCLSAVIESSDVSPICFGDSVTMNIITKSGALIQWQKDGVDITGAAGTTFNATQTGSYKAIASIPGSLGTTCIAYSNSINVLVKENAAITINSAPAICDGTPVILNANVGNGLSYQWNLNGNAIPNANVATYSATNAGIYGLMLEDGSCVSNDQITLFAGTTPASPLVIPQGSLMLCNGSTVLLETQAIADISYQWTVNGNNIPTANANSFTVDSSGLYCLNITTIAGCTSTSNCLNVSNCVGFEALLASDVTLYPNPVSQWLYIQIPRNHQVVYIVISDIQGRVLPIKAVSQSNGMYLIPVSNLASGLYQIRINTEQGIITKRFLRAE